MFNLNCPRGPLELREVYDLFRAEVARIRLLIAAELSVLCGAWERIHGKA